MAETKPTSVPEWNTDGENRTEPNSAKKALGWELNEAPSSAFFNWLSYWAGAWMKWLNERLFDGGGGPKDFVVRAPQGVEGDGGAMVAIGGEPADGHGGLGITSGGAGVGTDRNGGNGILSGGPSTGNGFSKAVMQAATAGQGAGTDARSPEDYWRANGETGKVEGVRPVVIRHDQNAIPSVDIDNRSIIGGAPGVLVKTNSSHAAYEGESTGPVATCGFFLGEYIGAEGRATGDQDSSGVVGRNSGSGYGVTASADTTSPVRAALRTVPQDADPTNPQKGDSYTNSVTGLRAHYDGTYWQNMSPVAYRLTSTVQRTATGTFQTYTIPANAMRGGTVIRVTASGTFDPSSQSDIVFAVRRNENSIIAILAEDVNGDPVSWRIQAEITVRAAGDTAAIALAGHGGFYRLGGGYAANGLLQVDADTGQLDTTDTNTIDVAMTLGSGSGTAELQQFIVEII